jgi:Secretion system C-terminal sorting domain
LAYDVTFKTNVLAIADACEKNGLVVKKAQVLAQYLNPNTTLIFANNCNSGSKLLQETDLKNNTFETKFSEAESNFSLVPNPNNGYFNIVLNQDNDLKTVDIKILDISGKVLLEQKVIVENAKASIDASQLQKGLYLMQINSNQMLKFVKDNL